MAFPPGRLAAGCPKREYREVGRGVEFPPTRCSDSRDPTALRGPVTSSDQNSSSTPPGSSSGDGSSGNKGGSPVKQPPWTRWLLLLGLTFLLWSLLADRPLGHDLSYSRFRALLDG